MNEQNFFEESYLSLSDILCLQPKNNAQRTNQSENEIKFLQNDKIVSFPIKNREYSSRSDQQSKEQQSGENSKYGKEKSQKKEYSKNYRRRHKEYVKSIEKMNTKYERRIQELTLKVDQLTEEIRSLKYGRQISDNLFDSPFTKEKEQTLKELVNQSERENQTSWDKMKQFGQIYGFAGKEKINLLNYYMSQIIDNLLIDHHKNFVLNGLEDFEITKPYAQALYQKEQELVGCTSADFILLKKYLKKWMPQTLKKFHKIGQNFYESYVKLINQAIEIQNHFTSIEDGIYKMLPAEKYLCVLRWYEQNKHCKEIQIVRKEWIESFRKK